MYIVHCSFAYIRVTSYNLFFCNSKGEADAGFVPPPPVDAHALEAQQVCSTIFLDVAQTFCKVWNRNLKYKLYVRYPNHSICSAELIPT